MAAAAALLRSLATKMARAPPAPRLSAARGLHSGPGRSSRASTPSSGSSLSHEELVKEIVTKWNRTKGESKQDVKAAMIRTAANLASVLVFGGTLFYCYVMPAVNESLSRERLKMKDDMVRVIRQEFERAHIEGERRKAKISEGRSMQTSGGHQASDDLDEA